MIINEILIPRNSMKQVQIITRPGKINEIMDALRKVEVGGLTISDVKGQGRAEPPLVGDTYSMEQIMIAINDDKVKEVFDSVGKVACTGTKGDGKIFVTDITDAFDICTKKTGEAAL